MSDFETKSIREQIYDASKGYKEMPHEPKCNSVQPVQETVEDRIRIIAEKEIRVGWSLPSQKYRPMSNMVTGYRKRLPELGPQLSKPRDKKV